MSVTIYGDEDLDVCECHHLANNHRGKCRVPRCRCPQLRVSHRAAQKRLERRRKVEEKDPDGRLVRGEPLTTCRHCGRQLTKQRREDFVICQKCDTG